MDFSRLLDDPGARLGLSLLAAASPTVRNAGFGERLAQGVGMFDQWQANKSAEEERKRRMALQEQMAQIQLQALLQQQAAAKKAQEQQALDQGLLRNQVAGVGPDGMGPAAPNPQLDPRAFLGGGGSLQGVEQLLGLQSVLNPPKPKPLITKPGDIARDPETGQQVWANPAEPEKTPEALRALEMIYGKGSPQYLQAAQQYARKMTTHAPAAQMNNFGTPVQGIDAQGNPVFIQPTKDGSSPHVIPGVRPPMSAAEERAAAEQRNRERQGQQMMSVMGEARKILQEGNATQSGIGTVVDAGARVFGKTTVGAQDSARLDALSGWLVANVPRMEGPQSNYDVQNYMKMAGKVGDSTVPIPERMAALQEVEKLQRKYADINQTPMPPSQDQTRVRRFNPETGRIE